MKQKPDQLFQQLFKHIQKTRIEGWDPYDILNCHFLQKKLLNQKLLLVLTQFNRISPVNFRSLLQIPKIYNSKAMALILYALLNSKCGSNGDIVDFVKNWLIDNKSEKFKEYTIGFTFDIVLEHYASSRDNPSLIITLFVMYAFIKYLEKVNNEEVYHILSAFHRLIERQLPCFESSKTLWYSYNFEKINEIYNSTAKIGKFYTLLYKINGDSQLPIKVEKILNYLASKQRPDGSWPYGKNMAYTDGFHTAFILEAIWYMQKIVDIPQHMKMFSKGLNHYKKNLFKPNGQPYYFHPMYWPDDIRRHLVETDIRDCAMAIVLFSNLGEKNWEEKVFNWTLANMYDHEKGYFYYYKNRFWTNKIEFIRWQAWMLYALSHMKTLRY